MDIKGNRFSEVHVIAAPKEHESLMANAEFCHRHGVSSAAVYKGKVKYRGPEDRCVCRVAELYCMRHTALPERTAERRVVRIRQTPPLVAFS